MTNVDMSVENEILTIKIDLSKTYGKSKSGKTTTVATTNGFTGIPEHPDLKIGINAYKKLKDTE